MRLSSSVSSLKNSIDFNNNTSNMKKWENSHMYLSSYDKLSEKNVNTIHINNT